MVNAVEQMKKHNNILSPYACKDNEAIYLEEANNNDIRTPFFHDIDKIIYSLSFIRYQDKTQVYSWNNHAHVATRMIHVQLVSKIARTIGRALGLNEDLIEAASLGHDLGHVPFGHEGERILNKISLECGEGYFFHNIQSVRNLMNVEGYGKGLNVSIQVLDAIMCHNGEFALGEYHYKKKTKEEFLEEYEACTKDPGRVAKLIPMTLEGCVVRISDLIAYLGRDIDDAVRLGDIKREDLPESITKILGTTTSSIVNTCVNDIIRNSFGHDYIKLSPEVYKAIEEFKKFNYKNIYNYSPSHKEKDNLEIMFNYLFKGYIEDIETNNSNSPIVSSYLARMDVEYKKTKRERIVLDYIAGMTDDFFMREYERMSGNEDTKI